MNLVTDRVAIHCVLKLSHRGRVELETMPRNKCWSKFQENIASALTSSFLCVSYHELRCRVTVYYFGRYRPVPYFLRIPECFTYYPAQCCGSGIRWLFDPWIRDPEEVFSGSRIPNPYFWEPSDNFWVKSSIICWKLAQIFFFNISKIK